jgi:hypothetical protein
MTTHKLPDKDIEISDDELDQLIEQRENGGGVCEPQFGDEYCYVSSHGVVIQISWKATQNDRYRLKRSNAFKTEEEAADYRDYLKAKADIAHAIREANDGWTPEWGNTCNYSLYHDIRGGWCTSKSHKIDDSFLPYAKSKEILKNIRDEQAGELETIANYRRHHNV